MVQQFRKRQTGANAGNKWSDKNGATRVGYTSGSVLVWV